MWTFISNPAVWIAFGIGIVAAWAASTLPRFAKAAILWFPKRVGRGLLGLFKEAYYSTKASKDPTAASIYVGYNLALLTADTALGLIALGTIATYQIADPSWTSPYHVWVFRAACVVVVILTYAGFKRFLYVALAYTAIFNPPKERPKLKIGSFEFFPAKATPISTPPQSEQH